MTIFVKGAPGVYTPDQVEKMQRRLASEAPPLETPADREERAKRILLEEARDLGLGAQ